MNKLHPNQLQLDLRSSGSTPADVKREGSVGETAAQNRASSLGERRVQRARLAPTGQANTAHLPLQFYFHIISISKRLLAALAFGSDKRRVGEGVEKEGKSGRQSKAMSMYFICYVTEFCPFLKLLTTAHIHPVLYALILALWFISSLSVTPSFGFY